MGFLEGLFVQTVPEMPVSATVITASAVVDPGYLHRVAASEDPIELTITPLTLAQVAGKRFGVKVHTAAESPGTLTILVPVGQQIETDDGELGDGIEIAEQTLGTYREWLCDAEGNWLMISGGW